MAEDHLDLDLVAGSLGDIREVDTNVHSVGVYQEIADELDLEVGSQVPVEFNSSDASVNFQVSAIYGEDIIAGESWIIDLTTWEEYFNRNLDTFASAITASGVSQSEARAAIDRVGLNYPQVDVQTKQEFNDAQVGQINLVVTIVNVFLYLALVIAFIGVANTLALSVIERTRELGLLRAVGMNRGQMLRMVLGEGVIISLFGGRAGHSAGHSLRGGNSQSPAQRLHLHLGYTYPDSHRLPHSRSNSRLDCSPAACPSSQSFECAGGHSQRVAQACRFLNSYQILLKPMPRIATKTLR